MDDVEVRELRYFIAVAEELNFTRAAARLGIAQPPLSAAIGKLERKLGTALFVRTSRRVTLTEAGAVLLDQGRAAVEGVAAAVERARRTGAGPGGLTLAVKSGTGTALLREILQRCAQDPRTPGIHLLLGHPGGPAAAVRAGAADVAILRAPFDRRGLETETLLVEPRVAVLPADHRLARRGKMHRADLAGERMPRWAGTADPVAAAHWTGTDGPDTPGSGRVDNPAAALSGSGLGPGLGPEINDVNQLWDAVALGSAVAFVPASAAAQNRRPELAFVPMHDVSPSRVVVAWPEASRSRSVAEFVRTAVDVASRRTGQTAAAR